MLSLRAASPPNAPGHYRCVGYTAASTQPDMARFASFSCPRLPGFVHRRQRRATWFLFPSALASTDIRPKAQSNTLLLKHRSLVLGPSGGQVALWFSSSSGLTFPSSGPAFGSPLKSNVRPHHMRTQAKVLAFTLVLSASGCALPPSTEAVDSPPATTMRLNAPPGSYYRWRADFAETPKSRFRVRIDRPQSDGVWRPLASVCIHPDLDQEAGACARLIVPDHGRYALIYADEKIGDEWRRIEPGGAFRQVGVHDAVDVRVEVMADGVHMAADGQTLFILPGLTQVPMLSLTCSSAVCTFEMNE